MSESTPENQAEAIKQTLFRGEKIQAIKMYCEQTKVGLAEAKAAVEELEAELRRTTPESFAKPAAKGGCGMTIVVLSLGILAAIRLWHHLT